MDSKMKRCQLSFRGRTSCQMESLDSRTPKIHLKYFLYTFVLLVLLQLQQTETHNTTCYPYCGGTTPKPYCYDNGNGTCSCVCSKHTKLGSLFM
uniref:Dermacentor 9 kDa family member n=1 Tax=Rhipicephalus zambeziensis TaxID=60191 RepID=A0A224YC78_9ACAR